MPRSLMLSALLAPAMALAGGWTLPRDSVRVVPYVSFATATRAYDPGEQFDHLPSNAAYYALIAGATVEYGWQPGLTIIAEVPFGRFWMGGFKDARPAPKPVVGLAWLAAGARMGIGGIEPAALAVVVMPAYVPGHPRDAGDTTSFYVASFLQVTSGLEFGISTRFGWIESSLAHVSRGPEVGDQLRASFGFGFTKAKVLIAKLLAGTSVTLRGVPSEPLDPLSLANAEDLLWFEPSIILPLSASVRLVAGYRVTAWGRHTLAMEGGSIGLIID